MIDLHCDTLLKCVENKDHRLRRNNGHIDLERMRRGGLNAQCFAVYVPTHEEDMGLAPMDYYREAAVLFHREMAANADLIAPALTAGEIVRNMDNGKLSAILTVEDAVALEGDIRRLDEFWADGVRMASFTWNYENSLGWPNSADPDEMKKGLKEFGFACLERMNELGMVADVSHLSEGGFWDIVSHSKNAEIVEVGELESNEEVWAEWLNQNRGYAITDRKAMEAGAGKYLNFVKIVLRKKTAK